MGIGAALKQAHAGGLQETVPGGWTRHLSDEKLQQVLVLRRAANHRSLAFQLYEVPEPVMVKDLQTQCEMAEKCLASGPLSEEQLWASIASVVASITVAMEASSKATTCTWLRDEIIDGETSDDDAGTLKEAASNRVFQLYAASKEGFAKDLLGSVKELAEACRMVLAEAARIAEEARAQPKSPCHGRCEQQCIDNSSSHATEYEVLPEARFLVLGGRKRVLSGEKIYHVLVLDRADAELECLDSLLSEYVHDATVLKDLQTQCELAEKALASGNLSAEELFASIALVVAKLTEVLNAVRKADSRICIPDFILDGDSPEENERQSNTVDLMYAGAPQSLEEFLLYPVKGLNTVCKIVLEKAADAATASNADTSLDTTALSK